jgi:hypothetical protein
VNLLPLFEEGELGRILHTVAPVIARNLVEESLAMSVLNCPVSPTEMGRFKRVVVLHEAMLDQARRAIACWGIVGRRLGVAKDIRIVISKLAWEEPWRWSEK